MKINCVVIEDDAMFCKAVELYIDKTNFLNLIGSYSNAESAINEMNPDEVDVLLLDVEMPGMSGIEFMKAFSKLPHVILMTSYKDYAFDAFENNVVDYLLKPFDYSRFLKGINKVKERIEISIGGDVQQDEIFVRTESCYMKIKNKEILFIEALGDYINIHTPEKKYKVHSTMKGIEAKLPPSKFLRVHRSYIIPLDRIELIEDNIIKIGKSHIPVGRSYRDDLMQKINLV